MNLRLVSGSAKHERGTSCVSQIASRALPAPLSLRLLFQVQIAANYEPDQVLHSVIVGP